jgi:hypothetical protein
MTRSIVLEGSTQVIDSLRGLVESLDVPSAIEDGASWFAEKVREKTPPGYSGKLPESVLYEVDDNGAYVGFDASVETAGIAALDSVTRPRTRGRSVLSRPAKEWVQAEELASVLEQSFDDYSSGAVSVIEDGISRKMA